MRLFAVAALAGLMLAAASGPAAARTWTDPAGRVIFDSPDGWSVMEQRGTNMTYVIVGTADNECHVIAAQNAGTAAMTVDQIINVGGNDANYTDEAWLRVGATMPMVFSSPPQVLSKREETNAGWPLQRAELQGERLVHSAVQLRPGLDIFAFCQTYEGADPIATYEALIRSIRTPNDQALQAQVTPAPPPAQ